MGAGIASPGCCNCSNLCGCAGFPSTLTMHSVFNSAVWPFSFLGPYTITLGATPPGVGAMTPVIGDSFGTQGYWSAGFTDTTLGGPIYIHLTCLNGLPAAVTYQPSPARNTGRILWYAFLGFGTDTGSGINKCSPFLLNQTKTPNPGGVNQWTVS